jgi:hypothetical protein
VAVAVRVGVGEVHQPVEVEVEDAVQVRHLGVRADRGEPVGQQPHHRVRMDRGLEGVQFGPKGDAGAAVEGAVGEVAGDTVDDLGQGAVDGTTRTGAVDRGLHEHGADGEQVRIGIAVAAQQIHRGAAGARIEARRADLQGRTDLGLRGGYSVADRCPVRDQRRDPLAGEVGIQVDE